MRSASRAIAALLLAVSAFAWAEPRQALVIGNLAYPAPAAKLANPLHDAELIAAHLRKLGFEVELASNLSRRGMFDAIDRHAGRLGADSTGLVFYSGHGIGYKGLNYLIPVDAWPREPALLDSDAVALEEILARLKRRKNRLNIVIVDACRDNPFAGRTRSGDAGFASMQAPAGMIVAFSTSPGAPAFDGAGQPNGPYARALSAAMLEKGTPIEKMFRNVRTSVGQATRGEQIPWESSSLTGADFFLAPSDGSPSFVARAPGRALTVAGGQTRGMGGYDWLADNADISWRLKNLSPQLLPALRSAAQGGDPKAQTILGEAYRDGAAGLARSDREAMRWLERATKSGYAIAMHELAEFYFKGRGTSRDTGKAFSLAKESADLEFPPAMATLGQFYLQGVGTEPDPAKGMKYVGESLQFMPVVAGVRR